MSRYTTLETSKKLYEAFPEWEKPKDDTEMHWIVGEDYPTPFVFDNCCWREYEDDEYICPAYDTDYLLEKLPKSLDGRQLNAWYEDDCTTYGYGRDVTVWHEESELPVEALAALALKLKKEGIL